MNSWNDMLLINYVLANDKNKSLKTSYFHNSLFRNSCYLFGIFVLANEIYRVKHPQIIINIKSNRFNKG